jgi:hypothetical protein
VTHYLKTILTSDVIGLLGQDVLVELSNVSRSGCLLSSLTPIPVGTLGTLSVEIDGAVYSDEVRIARCLEVTGAGDRYQVGVEFLALRRPHRGSLRVYAASVGAHGNENGNGNGNGIAAPLRFKPLP